jgi:hypothetical protein
MSKPVRVSALSMIVLAALAACGGGGGGGGGVIAPGRTSGTPVEVNFTSFGAVRPNQTVVMSSGISQGGSGTDSAFTLGAATDSNSTARLTFDGNGELSGIAVNTPQANLSFGPGETGCFTDAGCIGANANAFAVVMHPAELGWNYQSFGVWNVQSTPSSWLVGAISAGNVTMDGFVPTTGTAVFTGRSAGFYSDSAGTPYATTASMSANVNFSTRSIQFSTSDTTRINANTQVQTADNGLNLSGSWSYTQGVRQNGPVPGVFIAAGFSGPLVTQNGLLAGQAVGQFYGPAGEEIGGAYSLSGTGLSRMIGAFGGKR